MIKQLVLILTMLSTFVFADDGYLNIDADFFEADEKEQKMYFKGNVKMSKNLNTLEANYLLINTKTSRQDKQKQVPENYMAEGDVKFTVHTDDNVLKGMGDKVYYYPEKQEYIIEGNGTLEDMKKEKTVVADKIYVNEMTGLIRIDGGENKPVKFRLKLDTKEDNTSE